MCLFKAITIIQRDALLTSTVVMLMVTFILASMLAVGQAWRCASHVYNDPCCIDVRTVKNDIIRYSTVKYNEPYQHGDRTVIVIFTWYVNICWLGSKWECNTEGRCQLENVLHFTHDLLQVWLNMTNITLLSDSTVHKKIT